MYSVGLVLGLLTFQRPRLVRGVVAFDRAERGLTWVLRRLDRTAMTVGHVVISARPLEGALLAHELHHVRQCRAWGPLFIPAYLLLAAIFGYRRHPFERAAMRAAGELVETVEAERRPAQQAFLEAEAAARAADGLVAALQAELQELETAARNLAPALEDAVAETRGAAGPLERAAPVLRMGSRALAARRIRRRTRELEAALGQARGEADAARARLEEAARAAAQAREKLHQVRRIEMEARRRMVLAQRSYSEALGRLSRLKLLDPAGGERDGPALRFVIVAREHRVLGSLSFEEWAKRAAGHGRTPRFILETQGEAIWLFRGEWIVADPELSLEDLTSVIGASGGIGRASCRERV